MNVVLDTNILISATLWNTSIANRLLNQLISKSNIFTSEYILLEFEKVLKRDFNKSEEDAAKLTEDLSIIFTTVNPSKKLNVVKDDPDDNKILECAVESSSDYIVTYDKHLLNLNKFENIKIITPEEMLRLL